MDTYPPVTSTTTTGSTTVTSTSSSSDNVAVISGSVIGAIVFVIALIVTLVLFIKRSKRNQPEGHENNDNRTIDNEVVDDNDSVPSIKHFLETLDRKYGSGLFTQYLNNFISESIDVSDISTLSNNEFESLGINKIGIRKKITKEAEKYKIWMDVFFFIGFEIQSTR